MSRNRALEAMQANELPTLLVDCRVEHRVNLNVEAYNLCWIPLVESAYVAQRPNYVFNQHGVGLCIEFDKMVELAAAERAIQYDGGIILTG